MDITDFLVTVDVRVSASPAAVWAALADLPVTSGSMAPDLADSGGSD